jgi:hypothetical protein
MKLPISATLGLALTTALAMTATLPAQAQDILTGDSRLACEAVLCLATGQRPNECTPSLQRYFGIRHHKPGDTIRERINFLKKCPTSNQSPQMASLIDSMAAGAGTCDPASMNVALQMSWSTGDGPQRTFISNQLPAICNAYIQNAYTDQATLGVRYVGIPERGGYWIEAARWDAAQAAWIANAAVEDAARVRMTSEAITNAGR